VDGKVSKCEAIFRPPQTEKKSMQTLFSIRADGNLCAPSAIFHPRDGRLSKCEAIFHLPQTQKGLCLCYFPSATN